MQSCNVMYDFQLAIACASPISKHPCKIVQLSESLSLGSLHWAWVIRAVRIFLDCFCFFLLSL